MPIGATITAARGGRVSTVRDDRENFNGKGRDGFNVINIAHGDGTYGTYMHLNKGGALVKVGDLVREGDPIARSGASGLGPRAEPHLHFAARAGTVSLPTTFRNTTANPNGPTEGTICSAEPYAPDDR